MIRQVGRALSRGRSKRNVADDHQESAPNEQRMTKLLQNSDDDISLDDFDFLDHRVQVDTSEVDSFDFSSLAHGSSRKCKPVSPSSSTNFSVPASPLISSRSNTRSFRESQKNNLTTKENNEKREKRSFRTSGRRPLRRTHSNCSDDRVCDELTTENFSRSQSVPRGPSTSQRTDAESRATSKGSSRHRGKSQEPSLYSGDISKSHDSSDLLFDGKKRKSKMEKIIQLQEKNQRYKEEFRKVQKDRKALKKEIEVRKEEAATLTKEIDTQIAETSLLKQKLSEALNQLDGLKSAAGQDGHEEALTKKANYNKSLVDLEKLQKTVSALEETVSNKDIRVKDLEDQLHLQREIVDGLQDENEKLREQNEKVSNLDKQVFELTEVNERLKIDLDTTVQHASELVKDREDAIADLLRENDEIKRLLASKEESTDFVPKEDFERLKHDLVDASAALEEAQDRNIALEEEIESMVQKNEEMDNEQMRLRDELEAVQEKVTAAQNTLILLEQSEEMARRRASEVEDTLVEMEKRYADDIRDLEDLHKAALAAVEVAAHEKALSAAEAKAKAPPNPQEMMLQAAVANQQRKQAEASKGSWTGVIAGFRIGADSDDNLSVEQKRVKELESIRTEQAEEISKLKSELVRLKSTFNDTVYTNKKRVEQLETENEALSRSIQTLEKEVVHLRNSDSPYPDLISASSNSYE